MASIMPFHQVNWLKEYFHDEYIQRPLIDSSRVSTRFPYPALRSLFWYLSKDLYGIIVLDVRSSPQN